MIDRIQRGFHRIGIVAAVLVAIAGVAGVTIDQQSRLNNPRVAADRRLNTGGDDAQWFETARIRIEDAVPGLGITALFALASWTFFRGLGWVIAGFGKDQS